MIHSVRIRNFQALHDISLNLEPLTVIVGPSNVGKSAFMRAMRTLTSNRRGAEFISHGERTASISATTDRGTVTLTRSKGNGANDNSYTVTPSDPGHPLYPERVFLKLGGDTPPEVSAFLGIDSRDPINYAGQFDKPYLLDDSAGEVARVLGALTNVSVIFEAARESNRRKLTAAATLRTRSEDLQAIKQKIPAYRSLKQQDSALTAAEAHITAARQIEKQIARLTEALETQQTAARAVTALEPLAQRQIPSEQPLIEAQQRLGGLTAAIRSQITAHQALQAAQTALGAATIHQTELEQQYSEMLGEITDNLAGWIGAVANPEELKRENGITWITLDEAIRVFATYLETAATA